MSVEMRVEVITPEKATEWLKHNTCNRPLSQRHAATLAAAIIADQWELNGESVKFNGDGTLVDGQHRLTAIIKAGKAIKCYVARGLSAESYDTVDQGKSRSLADVLARHGEKSYTSLAAAVRWHQAVTTGASLASVCRFSAVTMVKYLEDNPTLRDSVEFIRHLPHTVKYPSGIMGALHCIFAARSKKLAEEFFSRVLVGEDLLREMPEFKLRALMIKDQSAVRKTPSEALCILTIKVWNAVKGNKMLKHLGIQVNETRAKIL